MPTVQDNPVVAEITTDIDAAAFIAALTGTYSQAEEDAINQFYISMKTNGLYSLTEEIKLLSLDSITDAAIDLISATTTGANNGMTFVAREGLSGNGSNAYYDTGFTMSTDGTVLSQNSVALHVYVRTNVAENAYDIGARTVSTRRNYIVSRWCSNDAFGKIAGGNGNFAIAPSTDSRGMWSISRTASNDMQLYKNQSSLVTQGSTSIALVEFPLYLGALNRGGAASDYASKQYAFYAITAGMTPAQIATFHTLVVNLLTAFGANI